MDSLMNEDGEDNNNYPYH